MSIVCVGPAAVKLLAFHSLCLPVCLFVVVQMVSTLKLTTGSESYFNDLHRYTTAHTQSQFDSLFQQLFFFSIRFLRA